MMLFETETLQKSKMDARKEVRMRKSDAKRIKAAAAELGLQESDFIRQAALMRAYEVEQHLSLSILPEEIFVKFQQAVNKSGDKNPRLSEAFEKSQKILREYDAE